MDVGATEDASIHAKPSLASVATADRELINRATDSQLESSLQPG